MAWYLVKQMDKYGSRRDASQPLIHPATTPTPTQWHRKNYEISEPFITNAL